MLAAVSVLTETEAVLRSLRDVWDEDSVDELDHALQAAARAIADGADDQLILASALHDVAHSPLVGAHAGAGHDAVAREWLTARFGERVGWLAGAHVAAKRYLVATEAGYRDGLSETSIISLRSQGGAAVDSSFVDHPWWTDAVRLRRYDDAAKDPLAGGATIDDVLLIAERVLSQNLSA
jgi:predicted HD phosphohydrolase